ncbi:hypothetical protein [Novosphingobium olei]|uniref:Transposase n=1 Tax=Novosphingobium olei TaxID=2728851 RepID=A0A7Y0BQK3_9SPHN|nr:hypothetical protein [Novosphingobium olei]NML94727.1 hypothetical protein [Novosphingobium olei]
MIRLAIDRRRARLAPWPANDNRGGAITREHRRLGIMLDWWAGELERIYGSRPPIGCDRGWWRKEFAEARFRVGEFRARIKSLG